MDLPLEFGLTNRLVKQIGVLKEIERILSFVFVFFLDAHILFN